MQANLLAAFAVNDGVMGEVYNVAVGDRTTLISLFELIKKNLNAQGNLYSNAKAIKREFRAGDVLHSQADISKIRAYLGYAREVRIEAGIEKTVHWYIDKLRAH